MLRACRRVLKRGGAAAMIVIFDADPDSGTEPMRAGGVGGTAVGSIGDYDALMRAAGFENIKNTDVTATYETTIEAWITEWEAARHDLEPLMGAEDYIGRQEIRREGLEAVRSGSRKRYLITASRP